MARIRIERAGPLTSVQDRGRFGVLRHGISASGAMDRGAYDLAGQLAGAGEGGFEFTTAGLALRVRYGPVRAAGAGGHFTARLNGEILEWPFAARLAEGDLLDVAPGADGNYGYLRFGGDIDLPRVMNSLSTNSRAGLGGLEGRLLRPGDEIVIAGSGREPQVGTTRGTARRGPIRVVWGLHADLFDAEVRDRFIHAPFAISRRLDRLGVRLEDPRGIFVQASHLSLVSDAVVPGDIQITGDGVPVVLMRDHQPTGGYPRIATVISADFDRFAQMRPGTEIAFEPVSVEHAQRLLRSART